MSHAQRDLPTDGAGHLNVREAARQKLDAAAAGIRQKPVFSYIVRFTTKSRSVRCWSLSACADRYQEGTDQVVRKFLEFSKISQRPKMGGGAVFIFNSFRLDVANASMRKGKRAIPLTPKSFNVLRYLVERAGQLVTKDDLWRAVWPNVTVTDGALTICVSEICKALGDEAKTPRYIETVHRLGYRFIASVSTPQVRQSESAASNEQSLSLPNLLAPNHRFVGREQELARLRQYFEKTLRGERQIVFITGESGIGKTALVEAFQRQLADAPALWIGRGQCIEHYGAGEGYLPVLDALGRLCRQADGRRLLELLEQHAPTWLVQMPTLLTAAELKTLQRKVVGTTHTRMLRELAEAAETITRERPLVLWLEDLHWSDYSTLEWLDFLARRQDPARLLILGTYRPVEAILRDHLLKTLKQELQLHGLCIELPLEFLSAKAVRQYLIARFAADSPLLRGAGLGEDPAEEVLQKLSRIIYQRTDGNPLFMVNLVDYLIEQGFLQTSGRGLRADSVEVLEAGLVDTPPNIRLMIERNLERLDPKQQAVLEAASVAGAEFSSAAVAAALEEPLHEVEMCVATLSHHGQFIQAQGVKQWPDGIVTSSVKFLHALYRDVLYEHVLAGRRAELHTRIAEREEAAYGTQAREMAPQLAYHYGACGNKAKALQYLELAGHFAQERNAFREALDIYQQALSLLRQQPESPERDVREMGLLQHMTLMLWITKGHSAPEAVDASQRAGTLAEKMGSLLQHWMWIIARCLGAFGSGDVLAANMLADQAFELAVREGSAFSLAGACTVQIIMRFWRGNLAGAEESFTTGRKFFGDPAFRQLPGGGVAAAFAYASASAWICGRADVARERISLMETSIENNLFDVALSKSLGANVRVLMGEYQHAEELAAQAVELSEKHQILQIATDSRAALGYARARRGHAAEGIEFLRQAIRSALEVGARFPGVMMYTTFLAEALESSGAIAEALQTAEEALQINPDELLYRPETIRVRGELRLKLGQSDLAEADFRDAITLARTMAGKIWELRSTVSLSRLLASEGRREEARTVLAEIYNSFTEGFDTADLKDAKALLDELAT